MKACLKDSSKFFTKEEISVIKQFIKMLQRDTSLKKDVEISFESDDTKVPITTGVRMPNHKIHVLAKGRLLVDVMRTIAHEWSHEYQHQKLGVKDTDPIQDIGGPEENMANALSGIFVKKFAKQYPQVKELMYGNVNESVINEISPKSSGVTAFLEFMKHHDEYMTQMGFRNYDRLEDYVHTATYDEFSDLQDELEEIVKKKDNYIGNEMDEIERAVQDLSRDGEMETTVQDVVDAFTKAKEVIIPKDVWSKLENTESNQIKKGEIKKVEDLAKKYNKTLPSALKKALIRNEYNPPLILKFGDRYHLVAGNTRLSTAAALGMKPRVIIAEI
jgi:FtsZ-binding cell division protein ZapB